MGTNNCLSIIQVHILFADSFLSNCYNQFLFCFQGVTNIRDPPDLTRLTFSSGLNQSSSDGRIRLKSLSLLDPECTIKLMDLTEQDYSVNAPVDLLLQGADLLTALDIPM